MVKLRKQFPRIVVKYIATENGGTHRLELPDPITAYLFMSDVESHFDKPGSFDAHGRRRVES